MSEPRSGWETVEISGKPADVFTPPEDGPLPHAVLFLHGRSGRTIIDDPVFTAELARYRLPAVCPHGKQSWWLDRICREFDETLTPLTFVREQVVPWVGERWNVAVPAIGLLGIGMGGQGVLQLAYRWPRQFQVVAAIAPAVDFQNLWGQGPPLDDMFASREAARQQTATLHVHPLNWPRSQLLACDPKDADWYESSERLASKLHSTGIPFESDFETSAGGHCWTYYQAMAPRCTQFLVEHLGK